MLGAWIYPTGQNRISLVFFRSSSLTCCMNRDVFHTGDWECKLSALPVSLWLKQSPLNFSAWGEDPSLKWSLPQPSHMLSQLVRLLVWVRRGWGQLCPKTVQRKPRKDYSGSQPYLLYCGNPKDSWLYSRSYGLDQKHQGIALTLDETPIGLSKKMVPKAAASSKSVPFNSKKPHYTQRASWDAIFQMTDRSLHFFGT